MAKTVKESFWTSTKIAECWWEEENDRDIDKATDEDKKKINTKADAITRNFRKILTNKLKFTNTELDELFRNTSETGKKSEFIFGNGEPDIPNVMKDLMEIGKQNFITEKQREMLENCLLRLCQLTKDKDEAEVVVREKHVVYKNDGLILQKIEEYYLNTREEKYFKKRIFVEISTKRIEDDKVRKKIYNYQYHLIKKWAIRWYVIMCEVEKIRMAEKIELGQEEYTKRKMSKGAIEVVYIQGNSEDENTVAYSKEPTCLLIEDLCECFLRTYEEDSVKELKSILKKLDVEKEDFEAGTKEACYDFSLRIFNKFLENNLKNCEKDDYDYIIQEACKDLEVIPSMVEAKINDEIQEDEEKIELTKLDWIRKMIERKQSTQMRQTIFDLMEKL